MQPKSITARTLIVADMRLVLMCLLTDDVKSSRLLDIAYLWLWVRRATRGRSKHLLRMYVQIDKIYYSLFQMVGIIQCYILPILGLAQAYVQPDLPVVLSRNILSQQ